MKYAPIVLTPDEDYDGPGMCWVEATAERDEAIELARSELDLNAHPVVEVIGVLLREETEVEAKINGHEFPHYVTCTARARNAARYWKVTFE